jgi:hypothetical protein
VEPARSRADASLAVVRPVLVAVAELVVAEVVGLGVLLQRPVAAREAVEAMTGDRMSAAEYRQLATTKPKAHGSPRGDGGNPYVGLECRVCGRLVKTTDPAVLRTNIYADGTEDHWVEHQTCHPRPT